MALRGIIVGTGRAGTFLQRGAFMAAGAEIAAFVDVDLAKARQAAAEYRVPRSFASIEDAINACRPDFVSVCTSASSHLAVASAALRADCHVLVEKPLTTTIEEARQLASLSRSVGKALCVVHNHKFYPGVAKAAEMVHEGAIGRVLHVERCMTFLHERARMMEVDHWAHKLPGGRMFEANPHNIYLAYAFVGSMRLKHVLARKTSGRWPHMAIDEFTATLATDAATVQITMKMDLEVTEHQSRHGPNFLVLLGTKGSLWVTYEDCFFLETLRPGRTLSCTPASDAARSLIGSPFNDGTNSGHKYFIERFVGFLEGRYREPPASLEEAIETQRLNLEMALAAEASLTS
jgi:predicted dehydrogenase